jgi:hypothetical protein
MKNNWIGLSHHTSSRANLLDKHITVSKQVEKTSVLAFMHIIRESLNWILMLLVIVSINSRIVIFSQNINLQKNKFQFSPL